MSLSHELLARCTFPAARTRVDVGVSGGADSSALLALAVTAGLQATAVHVDHGLRPHSADEADVVAATAERLGAAFRSVRVEVAAGSNLEARARHARYEALGADALVGHTMDDRAETVLVNLMRGTGAEGLAALSPPDPRRPLLALRHAETVALCEELGLETVDDPTNDDPRFVRNRIRHEVLPLLSAIAGRDVVPLLVRTSDLIGLDDSALQRASLQIDPTDARSLADADVALSARALRRWLAGVHEGYPPDSAEVARVLAVARGEAKATEVNGGWRIARSGQRLRFQRPHASP